MNEATTVSQHYERASLIEKLRSALAASGLTDTQLTTKDLAGIDQFHSRGLGAVIAEILANPEPHVGQAYPLFGPVEVTPPQVAEIVSRTLGKPVRYEQVSGAKRVEEVSGGKDVPFLVQHIGAVAQMHALGQTAGTGDWVERITGRKPQSLAEFVEKHRAVWQ